MSLRNLLQSFIDIYRLCMSMLNVKIYMSKIRHLLFTSYISVSWKPSKTQ